MSKGHDNACEGVGRYTTYRRVIYQEYGCALTFSRSEAKTITVATPQLLKRFVDTMPMRNKHHFCLPEPLFIPIQTLSDA